MQEKARESKRKRDNKQAGNEVNKEEERSKPKVNKRNTVPRKDNPFTRGTSKTNKKGERGEEWREERREREKRREERREKRGEKKAREDKLERKRRSRRKENARDLGRNSRQKPGQAADIRKNT